MSGYSDGFVTLDPTARTITIKRLWPLFIRRALTVAFDDVISIHPAPDSSPRIGVKGWGVGLNGIGWAMDWRRILGLGDAYNRSFVMKYEAGYLRVGFSTENPAAFRKALDDALPAVARRGKYERTLWDEILVRSHRFLIYACLIYIGLLGVLATPFIQRHLLFSHAFRWPLFPKYDEPVRYGLAPYKTYNMALPTSDNLTIHAWHILSDPYYHTHTPYPLLPQSPLPPSAQRESLHLHPTIIYFHGNAATRAARYRVQICSTLSTRLGVNVVIPDYRGFGENAGKPSEDGLALDGRAAWDWLTREMDVPQDRIVLMGQSLGTGVVARLASDLAKEGIRPRGAVLIAPFASIAQLLTNYSILHFLPVLSPLGFFPSIQQWYMRCLVDRFESEKALQNVDTKILLLHSRDDPDIPYSHSEILFNSLLDPLLPPYPFSSSELADPESAQSSTYQTIRAKAEKERMTVQEGLVKEEAIDNFAVIKHFARSQGKGDVVFMNTFYGGHNLVSNHEGVVDVVGRFMRLGAGQEENLSGE